jgi:hypothetical protein
MTTVIDLGRAFDKITESAEFALLSSRFNRFCPFEATGMVRAEIRHGSFLAYMLDPRKPHGYGTQLLKAFLDTVYEPHSATDVHAMLTANANAVEIRREWRNIDLMIILPATKTIVVLELKIDASQGKDQLRTYRRLVERHWLKSDGWTHKFVFLTKSDEAAQDVWDELRFRQIVQKFDEIASSDTDAPARETLRYYVSMMRRHPVGDQATKEAARRLWAQHGETLNFLMKNRPYPIRQLFETLKSQASDLAAHASNPDFTVVPDEHESGIIRFGISQWDSVPGFCSANDWTSTNRLVLLELKLGAEGLGMFAYVGPSSRPFRKRLLAGLLSENLITRSAAQTPKWSMLSETEIFRPVDPYDFDQEEAAKAVTIAISLFVGRVFAEFNEVVHRVEKLART